MTIKADDILKEAILLERRGHAFYTHVAKQTDNSAAREFFEYMAKEEVAHVAELSTQFKSFQKTGAFTKIAMEEGHSAQLEEILSERIRNEISAASFEAAAIDAAISLEQRAVEVYAGRAREAIDPQEKALYQQLAQWEETHLRNLSRLSRDLRDKIWYDNSFWPM